MKYSNLLLGTCLLCLFTACKPDFDLNASYKDVTVVYGILSYQDSIHYVKIYKGFQSNNNLYFDVKNPDSIYYYDAIDVVLQEYKDGRLNKKIPLKYTHDFPRDTGIFYYGDERIIYYTTEEIKRDMIYKIVIDNKRTGKVTEGQTPIVNDFEITSSYTLIDMLAPRGTMSFTKAEHAAGYEIHVNFLYFEVNRSGEVVKTGSIGKNITPRPGQGFQTNYVGDFYQEFAYTFYDDIAAELKPNDMVTRYAGRPGSSSPIEVIGWAAGESMINFLLSNQPSNSFTQVNTIYTNLVASEDGLVFGFLSSKVQSPPKGFGITQASELELVQGTKTGHLGFRPWLESIEHNSK